MLRSLYIQNYALIETLDISLEKGFSVITGETGAGKSIILGAIGLLKGQRADMKAIRKGASKCVIEARFDVSAYNMQPLFEQNDWDYAAECILRREITASGKSRAFINDTPVSLAQLKELGEELIDIHSQHQNLLLNQEDFQLRVLDYIALLSKETAGYQAVYSSWCSVKRALAEAVGAVEKAKTEEDYIRYQYNQLAEARLKAGEQEELEQEADTLSHAEEIKAGLYKASAIMSGDDDGGVLEALKECRNLISGIQQVYQPADELAQRIESSFIELKDIARELEMQGEAVEFNPQRLDEVNERLNLIYSLQQKHRVSTVEQLLDLEHGYEEQLAGIDSSDEHLAELRRDCDNLYRQVCEQAGRLTAERHRAATLVEEQISRFLVNLGMPNARFVVEMGQRKEPGATGMDTVNFLFSANKNGTLQSLSSVASGGEIARVMLSVKAMIAGAVKLPTIIFDEIDTGVSGEIADKMADMMEYMGEQNRQVISITHLPQIAARGRVHYKVYKQDNEQETVSRIRRLNDEERVEEIARMVSGATLTEAALNNARDLLKGRINQLRK